MLLNIEAGKRAGCSLCWKCDRKFILFVISFYFLYK